MVRDKQIPTGQALEQDKEQVLLLHSEELRIQGSGENEWSVRIKVRRQVKRETDCWDSSDFRGNEAIPAFREETEPLGNPGVSGT